MPLRRLSILLLCVSVFTTLSACSSSGGGAGSTLKPDGYVKPETSGSFTAASSKPLDEKGLIPSDMELPDQAQCGATGSVDPQLMVDDVVVATLSSATMNNAMSMTVTTQVTSLSESTLEKAIWYTAIDFVPAIAGYPATIDANAICDLSTGDCKETYVDWSPRNSPNSNTTEVCYVSAKSPSTVTGTVELGTYVMQNGQSVSAQRLHRVTSGAQIVCRSGTGPERVIGTGTKEDDIISTFDLINTEVSTCPMESELYRMMTIKTDGGQAISSQKSEIVSAPARLKC